MFGKRARCDVIATDVQLDDRAFRRYLSSLETLFPREMVRAVAMSAGIVKRQITSAIRNNGNSVTGSFNALSDIRNMLRSDKPGGVLGQSKSIKIYKTGRTGRYIDFVPGLRGQAARWQTGGTVGFENPAVRKLVKIRLAKKGYNRIELDKSAVQPERMVHGPVVMYAAKNMRKWLLGSLDKILEGKAGTFRFPNR